MGQKGFRMASDKVTNNIDTGLWAEYGDGCIAVAVTVFAEEGEYCLSYHQGRMPSHKREYFDEIDALEARMRETEPDLRKWRTTFEV